MGDLCITFPFAQFLRLPVRCLSAPACAACTADRCGHAQAGTQTGQAQISILEISNIFLWSSASSVEPLKSSPSLNLNKIEHSAKVSNAIRGQEWNLELLNGSYNMNRAKSQQKYK